MKKGDRVTYIDDVIIEQVRWGSHTDPRGLLENGKDYTVSKVDVRSYHTKVYLEGFEGSFNSVWFK